jgi:hypothetical protein
VAHTATIGSGADLGTVEVRTDEAVQVGGGTVDNLLAISYAGANATNARWLQFVWFEMTVSTPSAVATIAGSIPTSSGILPFTTDPSAPNWRVDSDPDIPFYIYGGGMGIRDPSTQVLFDRPGGGSVGPLFQAALSAVSGATSATFTAHFSTFLVINNTVVYHVPWAAATTATVAGTTATIANVVYTLGTAAAATRLRANLRAILHRDYPDYTAIR